MALQLNDITKLLISNNAFVDTLAEACLTNKMSSVGYTPNPDDEKLSAYFKQSSNTLASETTTSSERKVELDKSQTQVNGLNFDDKNTFEQQVENMRNHARFLITCVMVEKIFTGGLQAKIDNQTKLAFSALYKQATIGDCTQPAPRMNPLNPIASMSADAKYKAYIKLKGKSPAAAKNDYIQLGKKTLNNLQEKVDANIQRILTAVCQNLNDKELLNLCLNKEKLLPKSLKNTAVLFSLTKPDFSQMLATVQTGNSSNSSSYNSSSSDRSTDRKDNDGSAALGSQSAPGPTRPQAMEPKRKSSGPSS